MSGLPFLKVQSIGNHFPLVFLSDVAAGQVDGADLTPVLAKLAVDLCREHFGVGGDGLLALGQEGADLRLRMFNPDGTEDFCGNGLRCAAWVAHQKGWVGESFVIQHQGRSVPCSVKGDTVLTTLGLASYDPADVPHTGWGEWFNLSIWQGMDGGVPVNLFGSALTTGSTHVILPTFGLPDDEIFASISPKIENDARFPQRTSVIWTAEVEPGVLQVRIWERGVGETFGCGTGSSAAAADYMRRRDRGGPIEVRNPGGTVRVLAQAWNKPLTLEGTAQVVFAGMWLERG
ncbi:MAG: diaminopimelate epimerase [Fimbriimonas sp.]